jgi:hypothetical protein
MSTTTGSAPQERQVDWLRTLDWVGYVGIAVLAAYSFHRWGPRFFDPFLQSDDTRIVIFPFWSYRSDLFRDDYLAEAMLTWVPPAYRLLTYISIVFIDLLTLPKLIQLACIAWAGYHAFRIGHRRAGGAGALLGVFLVLHSAHLLHRTGGGLPRAFSYPVLFMLMDAIDARRPRAAAGATVLGFAFYPPAGLIASLVYGFWQLSEAASTWRRHGRRHPGIRKRIVEVAVTASVCLAVLLPSIRPGGEYGRLHTAEEAKAMEVFGPAGRMHLMPLRDLTEALEKERLLQASISNDAPLGRLLSPPEVGEATAFDLILIVALALLLLRRPKEALLPLLVLGVGIAGFEVANRLAFRLYDPARMLSITFPVASITLMIRSFSQPMRTSDRPVANRCFAFGATLLLVLIQGPALESKYAHLNIDARPQQALFKLIRELPTEVLIAGHPRRMDNVPLWGRRPILISEETSQPWFTGIWAEVERRLDANLDAYYTNSEEPVRRLRERFGVTHMLVHEDDITFGAPDHAGLFEPYGSRMREMATGTWHRSFWHRVPAEAIVGRAAGFRLYDLERVLESGTAAVPDQAD